MLQLTGFLLQTQRCATDGKVGHHLLWDLKSALTQLHRLHLLLEALHISQQTLQKQAEFTWFQSDIKLQCAKASIQGAQRDNEGCMTSYFNVVWLPVSEPAVLLDSGV